MSKYEPVLRTAELGPGEMREVEVDGRPVVVANVGQTYYALDALCPQDGTDLARQGRLKDDCLVCPTDESAYDIRTGAQVEPGDGPGLRTYAIRVEQNEVLVGPGRE